jgi:hypothetical protein
VPLTGSSNSPVSSAWSTRSETSPRFGSAPGGSGSSQNDIVVRGSLSAEKAMSRNWMPLWGTRLTKAGMRPGDVVIGRIFLRTCLG